MLQDRKALLEQELRRLHTDALNMYIGLAVGGGDVHGKEYQEMKQKISTLSADLKEVNELIFQGQM